MSVTETSHTLPRSDGGTFPVTQVTPGARAPGLVVISSAYGVTDELRTTMRRYAATGYIVAAPDMFSRTVPGPLGQSDADRTAARGRLEGFDVALGLADMRAVMDDLRARPDCTGCSDFHPSPAGTIVGDFLVSELKYFRTLCVHYEARRALAILRIDVVQPEVGRFEHMAVGVDYVIFARHR